MSRTAHPNKPCPTRPYELVIASHVPTEEIGSEPDHANDWTYGYLAIYDFNDTVYTYWVIRPMVDGDPDIPCHDIGHVLANHPVQAGFPDGEGRLLRDRKWEDHYWAGRAVPGWTQKWMPYVQVVAGIKVPTFTTIEEAERWMEATHAAR